MRKLILILLTIIPIYANSQSFWCTVDDDLYHNKSHVTDNALFQDTLVVISGFVSNAACPYHILRLYDFQGKQIWEKGGYCDLLYTDSVSIYTAGFTPVDDVIGLEQLVISKYDRTGNEIYQAGYPDIPHYFWFNFIPLSIDVSDRGLVLVSSKNSVIKSDIIANTISEKQLNLNEEIKSVLFLNPETYLINTEHNLYKSDSSCSLVDSASFTESNVKTIIFRDTIYSLLSNKLIRLNKDLEIIDTLLLNSNGKLVDMESFNNSIWIQENRDDSLRLMNIKNSSITDTLSFELLLRNQRFIVSKNNCAFSGNSLSGQIAVLGYNGYEQNAEIKFSDIDITDFSIDSLELFYYPDYSGIEYPRGYNFNAEITVKNTGTDTINSFAIYTELDGGMNCAQNFFYQKFTDILVFPDHSLTVKSNRIYQEGVNLTENKNRLCFECLAPNSEIERDVTKNSLCKSFTITGIIDNDELNQFRVYPNPLTDILNIETKEGTKDIFITSISGKILYHKKLFDSKLRLDLTDFDCGIYLLKIISGKYSIAQMIIKN